MMGLMMGCGMTSCVSSSRFMLENRVMHDAMALEFTGDPEVDLVRGMIAHHQGAIAMCAVARETAGTANGLDGADPVSALDQSVVDMCTTVETNKAAEIEAMTSWLEGQSLSVTTSCEGSDSQDIRMGVVMGCGNTTSMSSQLYIAENMATRHGMAVEYTCDPQVDLMRARIPHHLGAIWACKIARASVTGNMSYLEGSIHLMPDGTVMAGGMHEMADGTWMANQHGTHEMSDGTMMSDSEMTSPPPPAGTLDPYIATLSDGIEAAETAEVDSMTSWLTDRSLVAETACASETAAPAPAPGGVHVMADGHTMTDAEMIALGYHQMLDGTWMSMGGMSNTEMMGLMMGCGMTDCTSSARYMLENRVMHDAMALEFTGDPEVDLVRGMIAHHQGAIAMCAVARETAGTANGLDGADPVSALDQSVVDMCTTVETNKAAEIEAMTSWLEGQSLSVTTSCEGSDS